MQATEVKDLLSRGQPSLVAADATLKEVAAKMIEDRTTRDVYVIDDARRFVGLITLRRLTHFLFASKIPDKSSATDLLELVSAEHAGHLAVKKSAHVHVDDLLAHAVGVMFRFDLNEIPVVDSDMVFVGSLNMLEILAAWNAGEFEDSAE